MQEAVESAAYLREQADRCVRLAKDISDPEAAAALRNMAMEYRIRAKAMEEAAIEPPPPKMDLPPQS